MSEERSMSMYRIMTIRLLLEKSEGHCWYCGENIDEKTAVIEHIIPIGHGGTHEPWNIVPACRSCNSIKSNLPLSEFRVLLARRRQIPKFTPEQREWIKATFGTDPRDMVDETQLFWFEKEGLA